jgi:hypothetical protein
MGKMRSELFFLSAGGDAVGLEEVPCVNWLHKDVWETLRLAPLRAGQAQGDTTGKGNDGSALTARGYKGRRCVRGPRFIARIHHERPTTAEATEPRSPRAATGDGAGYRNAPSRRRFSTIWRVALDLFSV